MTDEHEVPKAYTIHDLEWLSDEALRKLPVHDLLVSIVKVLIDHKDDISSLQFSMSDDL